MTEAEKLDAACYLYEKLCDLKSNPTWQVFKRYFACQDPEAIKLVGYATGQSPNPTRWRCRNPKPDTAGKFSESDAEMIFYAFRYCLGRQTYAVSDFCNYAKAHITQFRTKELNLMVREITEYETHDAKEDSKIKWLGDECDRICWLNLREVIKKELEKRYAD